MSEEQILIWEEALKPIIKVLFVLVPYSLLAFFLNQISFSSQLYVVGALSSAALLLVLIDFLLQNFLEQPLMFKIISLLLLTGAIYFAFTSIYWSYLQLLGEKIDNNAKIAMGIQVFLVLYVIYRGFKSFANTLWDLELA